jgi:hypothetical protein
MMCLLLMSVGCAAMIGQGGGGDIKSQTKVSSALLPLQRGRLVVWVVKPSAIKLPPPDSGTAGFTPMGYKEESVSTFGTSASGFGKTAGSVGISSSSPAISRTANVPANTAPADVDAVAAAQAGAKEQTSGSFGQGASNYGTAASNHGETSGSFGQTASTYGTDASNVGQTAGSFGESLSTVATAGLPKPVVAPKPWLQLVQERLPVVLPGSRVLFVEVASDKLAANLRRLDSMLGYPDVLVFDGFTPGWKGPSPEVRELEAGSVQEFLAASPRRLMVMNHAPHPEAAKAFLVFLDQQGVAR